MCGISKWMAMEEPEVGDVADLLVNDGRGLMTVSILARHDEDHVDVNLYPGSLTGQVATVPRANLQPLPKRGFHVVNGEGLD